MSTQHIRVQPHVSVEVASNDSDSVVSPLIQPIGDTGIDVHISKRIANDCKYLHLIQLFLECLKEI